MISDKLLVRLQEKYPGQRIATKAPTTLETGVYFLKTQTESRIEPSSRVTLNLKACTFTLSHDSLPGSIESFADQTRLNKVFYAIFSRF